MKTGDSMLFDSTALQGPEKLTGTPVKYLPIVFNFRALSVSMATPPQPPGR